MSTTAAKTRKRKTLLRGAVRAKDGRFLKLPTPNLTRQIKKI